MKKLLLSGVIFLALPLITLANPLKPAYSLKQDKTFVRVPFRMDTATVQISSTELFLTSVTGANGVRLNAHAIRFVQDFMTNNRKDVEQIRSNGKKAVAIIDRILAQNDLPSQLKYLAMIESEFKSSAVSGVGAVGPWQLMATTARDLGLKVNAKLDERRNYVKSTRAAAVYLKELYGQLGDWLLVIAAYNSGYGTVARVIRKSGSRDFWTLQKFLPPESRLHVKRFIGTQYILEGQGNVTTLTRDEASKQLSGSSMYVFNRDLSNAEAASAMTTTVTGKLYAKVIAASVNMDEESFDHFNPDFDKVMATENNSYDLKLPAEKMDLFMANKYQILNESVQLMLKGAPSGEAAGKSVATAG